MKYTRLCFLAKMLQHDKVLQIHGARKVGQGLLTSLQVMPSLFGEWYLDYYCTCHCEQIPRRYAFPPSHHLNPALHSDSGVASREAGDIYLAGSDSQGDFLENKTREKSLVLSAASESSGTWTDLNKSSIFFHSTVLYIQPQLKHTTEGHTGFHLLYVYQV